MPINASPNFTLSLPIKTPNNTPVCKTHTATHEKTHKHKRVMHIINFEQDEVLKKAKCRDIFETLKPCRNPSRQLKNSKNK